MHRLMELLLPFLHHFRVLKYIDIGIKEGAKLILDGRKPNIIGDYPDTCFINPTILKMFPLI